MYTDWALYYGASKSHGTNLKNLTAIMTRLQIPITSMSAEPFVTTAVSTSPIMASRADRHVPLETTTVHSLHMDEMRRMVVREQAEILKQVTAGMTKINNQQKTDMVKLLKEQLAAIRSDVALAGELEVEQEVEHSKKQCNSRLKDNSSTSLMRREDEDGNKCL